MANVVGLGLERHNLKFVLGKLRKKMEKYLLTSFSAVKLCFSLETSMKTAVVMIVEKRRQ